MDRRSGSPGSGGFVLKEAQALALADLPDPKLAQLYAYWRSRLRGRPMPARADIDPVDLRGNIGRLHLLDIEGAGIYRYRLYGSGVTNPDRADMTGKTTMDYKDRLFGDMVTGHITEVVQSQTPAGYRIVGEYNLQPYVYNRLMLPLSDDCLQVNKILVGTQRETVPPSALRRVL